MTNSAAETIRALAGDQPIDIAIVLGSGLGGLTQQVSDAVQIPYGDLPGFHEPSVSGHKGAVYVGQLGTARVLLLAGRAHFYEAGNAAAMRPALEAVAALGISRILLTNAAGSLREDAPPGTAMLINDHINLMGANPLIGETDERRFVPLHDAYDARLAALMRETAAERGIALPEGTYMWFSGPSFETPAEIRAARVLGADAVGMSTVPEVILARFLGLRVVAVSLVTNMASGLSSESLSHAHTKTRAAEASAMFERLVMGFVDHLGDDLPASGEEG